MGYAQTTDSTSAKTKKVRVRQLTLRDRSIMMQQMKQRWDSLTPEQQAAAREGMKQMKAHYQNMTPEEKAAAKERFRDFKNRYESLTPEEKAKLEQHFKKRIQAIDSTKTKHTQDI